MKMKPFRAFLYILIILSSFLLVSYFLSKKVGFPCFYKRS